MQSPIRFMLPLVLATVAFAGARHKMVTLTGSGISSGGRTFGILKQFGFCDESPRSRSGHDYVPMGTGFYMLNTDETGDCRANRWIGFFGSELSAAVKEDSMASVYAGRLRNASIVKAVSMVAMPVFLSIGIGMMNDDIKGHDGEVEDGKSPRPISIAVTAGAGVAFLAYVVCSVTETHYLSKTAAAWNEKQNASILIDRQSVGIAYNRSF